MRRTNSQGSFGDNSQYKDTFNDVDDKDNGLNSVSVSARFRQNSTSNKLYTSKPPSLSPPSLIRAPKTTISSTYKASMMKNKKPTQTLDSFFKPKPTPVPKTSSSTSSSSSSSSLSFVASKPSTQPTVSLKRKPVYEDFSANKLKKHTVSTSSESSTPGLSEFAKSFYKQGDAVEKPYASPAVRSNTPLSSFRPSRFEAPGRLSIPSRFGISSTRAKHSPIFNNDRSSSSANDKPIRLSKEQQHVLDLVLEGKSLFYTGAAGTGKSVLTRAIIKALQENNREVGITASTGLAAQNIGGETLHRFSGLGLALAPKEQLLNMARKRGPQSNNWRQVHTLIIDEVSMVDGELFDKLDYVAKGIRKNTKPFGGIQIIATGDFFQLPPVDKNSVKHLAFESEAWKAAIQSTFVLTEVFRQKGDNTLINVLNAMRLGELTASMNQTLKTLNRKVEYPDGIEPTELYATRYEVENANASRLRKLTGARHFYLKQDDIPAARTDAQKAALVKRLEDAVMSPQRLELRHGAQVMLIRNMDSSLVNGSLGKVLAFLTLESFNAVFQDSVMKGISQDSEEFEEQLQQMEKQEMSVYTNRVNTQLKHSKCLRLSPVPEFEHNCPLDNTSDMVLPVIRFSTNVGSLVTTVKPFNFQISSSNHPDTIEAMRSQIPLILSWSISIHKAQGQTLDRVKVDLKTIFEVGHAYVAISRATSMERLQILNYDPQKVRVNQKVIAFYKQLACNFSSNADSLQEAEKKKRENYINIEPDEDDFFD